MEKMRMEGYAKTITIWRTFINGYHELLVCRFIYVATKMPRYLYNKGYFANAVAVDHANGVCDILLLEGNNDVLNGIQFCIREDVQSIKSVKPL